MPTLTETSTSITSPETPHDPTLDVWEFAVPLDPHAKAQFRQSSAPSSLKTRKTSSSYPINNNDVPQVHSRVNGYNSRPSENVPISRSPTNGSAFLDTPNPASLQRNDSTISSNQDGDSVFDLYGGGRISTMNGLNTDNYTAQNGAVSDDESKWIDRDKLLRIEGQDKEASRWIDSDKLAQIESKEMLQAGIRIPPKGSRSSFKTLQNHNADYKKQSIQVIGGDDPDEGKFYNPDEPSNDLRHPSEQALDYTSNQTRNRNGSSSKIPLSVSSPIPVRQQFIDRTAPLIRQPPSPDQGSDDDLSSSYIRSRKRSYSASSAVVLNADTESTSTSAATRPTRNARSQSHAAQTSTPTPGRKNSSKRVASSNLAKNRSRSNPQLNNSHRPTTSSSSHPSRDSGSQPGSAGKSNHAPEGPPPWSLSTYSPDPKLPPEQQLIPTVAKRLQQEQWEKEGVFASVYDSRLRPLKVEDGIDLDRRREAQKEEQDEKKRSEWPLKTPPETPVAQEAKQDNRRNSKIPTPSPSPIIINTQTNPQFPARTITKVNGRDMSGPEPIGGAIRVVENEGKEKKENKFCCCIVM